jgi:hypothetical protein
MLNLIWLIISYHTVVFTIKKFLSRKSKGPLQNGHHLTQELVNFKSHLLSKHESGLSEFLFWIS